MDGEILHPQDMPVGLNCNLNELQTEDCNLAVQQALLEARATSTQVCTSLTGSGALPDSQNTNFFLMDWKAASLNLH